MTEWRLRASLNRHSGRRTAIYIAAITALVLPAVLHPQIALASGVEANGIQELDGGMDWGAPSTTTNTCDYATAPTPTATSNGTVTGCGADNSVPTAPPYDWSSIFGPSSAWDTSPTACVSPATTCRTSTSIAGLVGYTFQPYNGDLFTQGSKDTLPVADWTCTQQSTPPKDQLVNAYGTAYRVPSSGYTTPLTAGDSVVFAALERPNTNGNSNAGYWLFQNVVVCDPATGEFVDQHGNPARHANNDLFLVGAFEGGGGNTLLQAYLWSCTPTSATNPTCSSATGGSLSGPVDLSNNNTSGIENGPCQAETGASFDGCEIVNQKAATVGGKTYFNSWTVTPPWTNIATGSGGIPGPGFLEMGIDLTSFYHHVNASATPPCFNSFLTDTRSSGSSTTAETKNFINADFPTCAAMRIHKFIDPAADGGDSILGTNGTASDTDVAGSNWSFAVYPGALTTPPSSGAVCTGTTAATGYLSCATGSLSNLAPGTYTVFETQKTGFYNTNPGGTGGAGTPNEAATVYKQVVLDGTDQTVDFGNNCLATLTLSVSGLPSGSTGATAAWTVTSGFDSSGSNATGTIALGNGGSGTTFSGTSAALFVVGDVISWSYYTDQGGGSTHKVLGDSALSVGASYPTCGVSDSATYTAPSIFGTKYKDNPPLGDGSSPGTEDTTIGGFEFKLMQGTTVVQDVTSKASGVFTFSSVGPGTYTVHEVVPSGWKQTYPVDSSGDPVDPTVTIYLDTTANQDAGNWLDTPLSHFTISVVSEGVLPGTTTDATKAGTITCSLSGESTTGNTYSSGNGLLEGTYSCSVEIVDP